MKHAKKHAILFAALSAFAAGSGLCHAAPRFEDNLHNVSYSLGHKFIPELVFMSSIRVRESIAGVDTTFPAEFCAAISNHWTSAWAARGIDDAPAPTNLNAELVELADAGGTKGFLITFPEPPRTPDNHFAFAFVDKEMELRYLTYEKTMPDVDTGASRAVLCGWNPNGSRYNLALKGGTARDDFLKLLSQYVSAAPSPIITWNPQE
jgi:hypothetical protein